MSQSKTIKWWKCFKRGRTSVDNDEHSARPSMVANTGNSSKQETVVVGNIRRTIYDVCDIVYGTGTYCGSGF